MLRVDQVHVVRHKVLVEGCSQRQVARELGIARETVRKYLAESIPLRKETQARARLVWEAVRTRVEQLPAESPQWTGGKQRLTATRLHSAGDDADAGVCPRGAPGTQDRRVLLSLMPVAIVALTKSSG
jgi:hypothetical protein